MPGEPIIKVNRTKLLTKIGENRAAHQAKVAQARKVYRRKIIEELDQRLDEAKNGGDIDPGFLYTLPIPKDYTLEYDRAVDQFSWDIGDTVQLTRTDFNRLVRDEWEWHGQFAASTQVYLAE